MTRMERMSTDPIRANPPIRHSAFDYRRTSAVQSLLQENWRISAQPALYWVENLMKGIRTMAVRSLKEFLRHLKPLLAVSTNGEWTDSQLLARYASERDEAAFTSLVRRHGALVLGVGRRILHHDQDAEDVFQATFILLARKAASSGWRKSIAGWLYCIAYRLALRTKAKTIRQRALQRAAGISSQTKSRTSEEGPVMLAVLDEELQRLSELCREPLLLCYLEGKTRDQAAHQLGWSLRTLERRLQQGLKLLRARLSKRGVELPAALLAAGLTQQAASAGMSAAKIAATVEAVMSFSASAGTAGGAISAQAAALTEGGLKAMTVTMGKPRAVMLLAACLMFVGVGAVGHRIMAEKRVEGNQAAEEKKANPPPVMVWPEGATVQGRVVDHRGVAVANAEVLLLGEEHIIVGAERRNVFAWNEAKKERAEPPSTRTNPKGEFRIARKKGTADRLAVIANGPLLWVVPRTSLAQGNNVIIKLPPAGSLAVKCDLPGKPPKLGVIIHLQTLEGMNWSNDVLRFNSPAYSVANPGETIIEHLPPGQYTVEREQQTPMGKNKVLSSASDRHLVKVESNQRAAIRFERKIGRPLVGWVRGLENAKLRYAYVMIMYSGPEEQLEANGRRGRLLTTFDTIPIKADGRFTTDPIPPGQYHLFLDAVRTSTPEQSEQQPDFQGQVQFTVPERGDMPKVEVVVKPVSEKVRLGFSNKEYRVRVVDDTGRPLPTLQVLIHTADAGCKWIEGGSGVAFLNAPYLFQDADVVDVLVRADGCASSVIRIEGEQRTKLRQGDTTFTLRRGQKVELRLRLPEGLTWPKGLRPETYFKEFAERVQMMRQPANRERGMESNINNLLNVHEIGAGRFEVRLAEETPPFYVAIHAPGFLQNFEAGPFTLAHVKQGVLQIDVPRPASLDIRFHPGRDTADEMPFKGVGFGVMRHLHGNSYLQVATDSAPSIRHELRLSDLSPGTYLVSVRTQPKKENKQPTSTEINLGAYNDQKKLVLHAGKTARVDFRYTPFDRNAFRGQRTAVLRIRRPDGTPAADREVKVMFQGGHYGQQVVFAGRLPKSSEITLKGLTDRVPSFCPKQMAYGVEVDGKRVGQFGFTNDGPTQEFEFHLAPGAGDMAPDVVLKSVATGKSMKLSSLRGKLFCLEFWATWCGPCQPAMAKLDKLSAEHSSTWKDRVALVPVSIDEDVDRVQAHVRSRGWTRVDHFWTSDTDKVGWDAPAARAFVVSGVPEAFLIGPDGRILWRGHPLAEFGGQDLRTRIESELAKQR
jgi:RNA polymerase sigma factor (sigma-70 family)